MQLQFLGAAGTVTGSRTLLVAGKTRVMVDCGLFQGYKDLRLQNWERLPVDPASVDAVLLTHAHLDHSGWIPRLVKQGFAGRVHCTAPTLEVARLLLLDSGYLQEEDAAYANRRGFSKHHPAEPLYTQADAEHALTRFVAVNGPLKLGEIEARWLHAGHILGASMVEVRARGRKVLFSGDLGRPDDLLMRAPDRVDEADVVVLESTYGDRRHPDVDPVAQLGEAVRRTTERGGIVLIPSFAVGRAQALLLGLHRLKEQGALPAGLPVYLDSPMAVNCTDLYVRHHEEHRLSEAEVRSLWEGVRLIRTADESKALSRRGGPMVVISAAGMLTGGRVLHHLKAFAGDHRNLLLFSGYQPGGTRGAAILKGGTEVKVHGMQVAIECEVASLQAWSAHADQDDLLAWLRAFKRPPGQVLLNHGEPDAVDALRRRIQDELGWRVAAARPGQVIEV